MSMKSAREEMNAQKDGAQLGLGLAGLIETRRGEPLSHLQELLLIDDPYAKDRWGLIAGVVTGYDDAFAGFRVIDPVSERFDDFPEPGKLPGSQGWEPLGASIAAYDVGGMDGPEGAIKQLIDNNQVSRFQYVMTRGLLSALYDSGHYPEALYSQMAELSRRIQPSLYAGCLAMLAVEPRYEPVPDEGDTYSIVQEAGNLQRAGTIPTNPQVLERVEGLDLSHLKLDEADAETTDGRLTIIAGMRMVSAAIHEQ